MPDRFSRGFEGYRQRGVRIGTLWNANKHDVDGEVTFSPEFDALGEVGMLDILQDIIGLLQAEYEEVKREGEEAWRRKRSTSST